jgi:hypothetical protein
VVSFLQVSDPLRFIIVEKLPASAAGRRALVQATKGCHDDLKRRCIYLGVRKNRTKNQTVTFDITFSRDVMPCGVINGTSV